MPTHDAPPSWPPLDLPVVPPLLPMEAKAATELPGDADGDGWQYEPKWDGFRCLVFRDDERVALQSKAGQPLGRYFPEVIAALRALPARRFVLDGELVVPAGGGFSFELLLQRIHPAERRIERLARETPAIVLPFDLLVDARGRSLLGKPLVERRTRLEAFAEEVLAGMPAVRLSPATTDRRIAEAWLARGGEGLDGVVAKLLGAPYRPGERTAMVKVKRLVTLDCVVGGFRWAANGKTIGSLLLGLYDDEGLLHHVGHTSAFTAARRAEVERAVLPLAGRGGFTGRAPGGPSRWAGERSGEWVPVEPRLVVEVRYHHFSGGRFRHGTQFVRWRTDKPPERCQFDQIPVPPGESADLSVRGA